MTTSCNEEPFDDENRSTNSSTSGVASISCAKPSFISFDDHLFSNKQVSTQDESSMQQTLESITLSNHNDNPPPSDEHHNASSTTSEEQIKARYCQYLAQNYTDDDDDSEQESSQYQAHMKHVNKDALQSNNKRRTSFKMTTGLLNTVNEKQSSSSPLLAAASASASASSTVDQHGHNNPQDPDEEDSNAGDSQMSSTAITLDNTDDNDDDEGADGIFIDKLAKQTSRLMANVQDYIQHFDHLSSSG